MSIGSWRRFTLGMIVAGAAMSIGVDAAAETALRFEHVLTIGSEGDEPGRFRYVEDMALSGDGRLIVIDAGHAHGQVFDKTTGAYLTRFGGRADGTVRFEKPEGVAVDPEGRVFVSDYETGLIWKLDRDFSFIRTFSGYGSGAGENIKAELPGIGHGRFYLPEAGNHRIDVFDLDGNFLFMFGERGGRPGQLNNPEAVKVGPDGRLYVSDLKNHRLQVFDADGNLIDVWGHVGDGVGALNAPTGIGFDRDGNVYVGELGNNRVQVFDTSGKSIAMWGRGGDAVGEFSAIHGLLVDPETGWVYVADTGNHRVQVFAPVTVAAEGSGGR